MPYTVPKCLYISLNGNDIRCIGRQCVHMPSYTSTMENLRFPVQSAIIRTIDIHAHTRPCLLLRCKYTEIHANTRLHPELDAHTSFPDMWASPAARVRHRTRYHEPLKHRIPASYIPIIFLCTRTWCSQVQDRYPDRIDNQSILLRRRCVYTTGSGVQGTIRFYNP